MFLYTAKYFFCNISNLFLRCDIYNNKKCDLVLDTVFVLFYIHMVLLPKEYQETDFVLKFVYFHHTTTI